MKFTESFLVSLVVISVANDVNYFIGNLFGANDDGAVLHNSAAVLPGNVLASFVLYFGVKLS